ncbi:MAG: tetratricopeptide repeat protein [Planctomycetes bacterium]|nr:tetratricopeptide repeat protein [Planctomycetota bacterium]HNZ66845.1 tetratricopeptide repeat protein [Planctomycetota bacterium]HON44065.1 tetratricopeptide repeat protein [Planctomycetota bacterium]HPY75248.1 tetratricopeptide repeat protein [Planctomycetota bacterium]HQB00796.1 tetratricopeptide repeat protein [Planctomycetota bacterium]
MKIIFLFFLMLSVSFAPATEKNFDQLSQLLFQSQEHFQQAQEFTKTNPEKAKQHYLEAAEILQTILKHTKNGKLHYNLGNIYFYLGDLGNAILHYRQAEKYIPHNPQLQQNLMYAQSKRIDKISEKVQTQILKTIFFWHYDLSSHTRLLLFLIFYSMFFISLITRCFFKHSSQIYIIIISLFLTLHLLISLTITTVQNTKQNQGIIIAKEIVARKGDGELYQPRFQQPLHAGTEFILIEDRGQWKQIELQDGNRAWIPTSACAIY